jgi:hypothetical protein
LLLLASWNALAPDVPRRSLSPAITVAYSAQGNPISYNGPPSPDLLIVGDSRAAQGIKHRELQRLWLAHSGVIYAPITYGGQLSDLLAAAKGRPARRLLIAVSPASIYCKQRQPLVKDLGQPMQLFRDIDDYLGQCGESLRGSLVTTVDARVWRDGWFYKSNEAKSDSFYFKLVSRDPERRMEELERFKIELRGLRRRGIEVACVRLPVSRSLRDIEDAHFPPALLEQACREVGIAFVDYARHGYKTHDGSHLAASDSRRFTRDLAADLQRAGWGRAQAPAGSR